MGRLRASVRMPRARATARRPKSPASRPPKAAAPPPRAPRRRAGGGTASTAWTTSWRSSPRLPAGWPTHYIVLEQAERLRTRAAFPALLALMRARELAGANVHVVLVSRSGWDEYENRPDRRRRAHPRNAFPADADLVRVLAQMRYPLGDTGGAASTADGDAERAVLPLCVGVHRHSGARDIGARAATVVGELWAEAAARSVAAKNLWSLPSREQEATLQWVRKRAKAVLESGGQCVALGPFPEARAREDALARGGRPPARAPVPRRSSFLRFQAAVTHTSQAATRSRSTARSLRRRAPCASVASAPPPRWRPREAAAQVAPRDPASSRSSASTRVYRRRRVGRGRPSHVRQGPDRRPARRWRPRCSQSPRHGWRRPSRRQRPLRCNVGDEVIESVARQVGPLHKYAVRQAA